MKIIVISKSNKMRSGSYWVFDGKARVKKKDGNVRHWEQIVVKTPSGYKNRKGKEAMLSHTVHRPI